MSHPMKLAPIAMVLVGSLGLGGCATKSFVREQVATVNQRVDALDAKLQTTDGTAQQALAQAQSAAGQAQNNGQRLDHWRPDNGLILPGTIYVGSTHASGFDSRYYGPMEIERLRRMEKLL